VEIIHSFSEYGDYRDFAEKVSRGVEKMKTIITVDIADIIAATVLGLLICLFMLGKLVVFLHKKLFDAMRRHWEDDEE
jgi:hypothetical protein